MNLVNIFISSTCYDLSQLRTDLFDFVTNVGHHPIISEAENFPVNPRKKTHENCIDAVRDNADIFILIVGNRYGSILENGKSITNNEFLAAKEKGIPIFIFIDKKTLNALDFWKSNKEADFSSIVDNKQIFNFIESARDSDKFWVFGFEKAQEIVSTLKIQFSYLFKDALKIRTKIDTDRSDIFNLDLSSKAMSILLEKNDFFEYEFFTQVLLDEIRKKENIKNDYLYKIYLEPKHTLSEDIAFTEWASNKLAIIQNHVKSLNNLISLAYGKYIGDPGIPSDLKGLYYISQTYARIFENILLWTVDAQSTIVPEDCKGLRDKVANLSSKLIEQVWSFPEVFEEFIQKQKHNHLNGLDNDDNSITITLEINKIDIANYNSEIEIYRRKKGL